MRSFNHLFEPTASTRINRMDLQSRYQEILRRVEKAATRSGRNAADVKLVAVSKTQPIEIVKKGFDAGIRIYGENKVQEGIEKIELLDEADSEWHLIGHLQKNKVRKVVNSFDVVQTVDSISLAQRLERICKEENRVGLKVLVQVDISGEESKFGVDEGELDKLGDFLVHCEHLKFSGLMAIPKFETDLEIVRESFKHLRDLRDKLAEKKMFENETGELSMGMSHDFEVAIEEGATIVRVGTAIFGSRISS